MNNFSKVIIFLFASLLFTGCGSSLSDQDLILQARELIDHEQFSSALIDLDHVKDKKTEEVILLRVSALSGLAGFRLFQLYDTIAYNRNVSPKFLIFFNLSRQYSSTDVSYSRSSIKTIEEFDSNITTRSKGLNTLFALMEVYKVSQILLKNSDLDRLGVLSNKWNPCNDANFPVLEIKEVIVSLNKVRMALRQITNDLRDADVELLFSSIDEAQKLSGYPFSILDEGNVQSSDVLNFRNFINKYILGNSNTCN